MFSAVFFRPASKAIMFLEKAILTGILRVAKERLFSGINNVTIYSALIKKYAKCFGFTEREVDKLLSKGKLESHANQVKAWYNGYNIVRTIIYNPCSIINFLTDEEATLQPYWVNTSDNKSAENLATASGAEISEEVTTLLAGGTISKNKLMKT